MSKLRKLQSEIDATLKRIHEGVAEWDALWDKLEETEDPSQRDKIVQEMKKELKKLQRQREQVRGWAAGGEIKDAATGPRLLEARKAVEREMERFKQLEKELKIKQFSSEGLLRDSTDPLMVAKCKCADWLSDAVAQLETQVEQFEADIEAEAPAQKGKAKPPRMAELEACMQRHQDHITRLEQCLRLLENDQVTPEEVEGALKDGIEYYLQSSTEPDFMADEHLYDCLPLKDIDDSIGKISAHTARPPGKGKPEGTDGEAAEAAPESSGKGKRGKTGKGAGKGKADGGKGDGGGAKPGGKPALAPPPGLPPPPSSPAATGTPTAASRATSFREVAAAGIKQAGSPTKQGPAGGPDTPSPSVEVGAAATPALAQRQRNGAAPAGAPLQAVGTGAAAAAGTPTAAAASQMSPAGGSGSALGATPAGMPQSVVAEAAPAAPEKLPKLQEALLPVQLPTQQAAQQLLQQQALSPTSTARLGMFNEQMRLAAAAHRAEQQRAEQQDQLQVQLLALQQQQQPRQQQQQEPPPLPGLLPAQPPPPLHVLGVPAGLPPVALASPASLNGHSPFAALASGISAAAGSPYAELAREASSTDVLAASSSQEPAAPTSPRVTASVTGDESPRSVQSSAGGAEAEGRPMTADSAAASTATTSAAATPRPGAGRIPTVLSFNHLQSQAESVLSLAAAEGGVLGGTADAAELGGRTDTVGDSTGMSGAANGGAAHRTCQLPWVPTLVDLQALETSVINRPQPGDADWRLADSTVSSGGGPAPAQRPAVTPASYPNMVHHSLRQEETWKKLSAETSLFNFYFQQGSRQQLFGANALKTQGWRFHTQFNAWFARQSQPRTVTDTHEIGPLVYFDAHLHNVTPSTSLLAQPQYSGWCPRVSRPDFLFEYKYMESEDTAAPSDPAS